MTKDDRYYQLTVTEYIDIINRLSSLERMANSQDGINQDGKDAIKAIQKRMTKDSSRVVIDNSHQKDWKAIATIVVSIAAAVIYVASEVLGILFK